jgi:hypothetical protein
MNTDAHAGLAAAKIRRGEAVTALKVAAETVVRDDSKVAACKATVDALSETRAGAIAAAKPDAVIATDAELLRARVTLEIAVSRAAASTAKHAAAVAELREAEAAVTQAARRVVDAEMVELARTFSAALDAALALGERLRELSMRDEPTALGSAPTLPATVTEALERMPQPNPYDTPMHVLRNGQHSHAFAHRLAELIDVSAAR